jgi:acetolactate synthase I/II/III large subunit
MAGPSPFAAAVADGLRQAGVQRLFGVPGGASLDLIEAAAGRGIGFVLAHTESAACMMAATYGRLTGTAGVAVVTRGPGLTSAANGLAQATLDRFPLLLLADGVPHADARRTAHQRLDQVRMAAPLAKHSGVLGGAAPSATVAAAAALACRPPSGAVHLTLDPSVPGDRLLTEHPAVTRAAGLDDDVRALFAGARRPVVIAGLDVVDAAAALRSAVSGLGCPVLATYQAKGVVAETEDDYAGLFTGAVIEAGLLRGADLIVGVGLDPVEPLPGSWPYQADVVLLHRHPVEAGYFGERARVVTGDYGGDLLPLLGQLRPSWPPGSGAKFRMAARGALEDGAAGFRPQDVVRAVREVAGDVTVTVDAGAHMLVAMALWDTGHPGRVLISNGLATMGFALPAAVGAALADPSARVVCLAGDGGLGMVVAELETLARLDLDVTVVVFNDATLTLIELKQPPGAAPDAVAYRATDFAAVARAMGVPAAVATTARQLHDQLTAAPRGPFLVDARIDRRSYRHVLQAIRGGSP